MSFSQSVFAATQTTKVKEKNAEFCCSKDSSGKGEVWNEEFPELIFSIIDTKITHSLAESRLVRPVSHVCTAAGDTAERPRQRRHRVISSSI